MHSSKGSCLSGSFGVLPDGSASPNGFRLRSKKMEAGFGDVGNLGNLGDLSDFVLVVGFLDLLGECSIGAEMLKC